MTVAFRSGNRADERDISALEDLIGQPLGHEFREFITTRDGSAPEPNLFTVNTGIQSGVNQFIPVRKIASERLNIENIADSAYPIAWAEGGNYVVLDEGCQGAVFFWDHEVPGQTHKLATGFGAFLELLRSFDSSSVRLAPGQVRSAWINPEFLKKILR